MDYSEDVRRAMSNKRLPCTMSSYRRAISMYKQYNRSKSSSEHFITMYFCLSPIQKVVFLHTFQIHLLSDDSLTQSAFPPFVTFVQPRFAPDRPALVLSFESFLPFRSMFASSLAFVQGQGQQ
jgi:hypothetical protein